MIARALVLALLGLALPAAAAAQVTSVVEEAAPVLRERHVYVHPDARPTISDAQAERLRRRIEAVGGSVYVAILPGDRDDARDVARRLRDEVGEPGAYAVVVSGRFLGAPSELADDAFREHRDEGLAATLLGFVDRVGAERSGQAEGASDGGPSGVGGLGLLAAIAAGIGGLVFLSRRRRAREQQAQLAQVREVAEDDLVALGDDIRALDLDVEMPAADPRAKEDYAAALTAYERASAAFDRARRPEDMEAVSSALEQGRFAMESAKARLAGRQPPERRPPCFFDPRHGPSVRDVEWTPEWGEPRLVPACAADAMRVEEGREPLTREIEVGGQRVPYYAAGPAFGPFAGGFFGGVAGGLLPVFLIGSMLGGGLGLGFPSDAWGGGHGDGDGLGGDFGGGDFGGGDFGGGDFGGGDFGGGGGDF